MGTRVIGVILAMASATEALDFKDTLCFSFYSDSSCTGPDPVWSGDSCIKSNECIDINNAGQNSTGQLSIKAAVPLDQQKSCDDTGRWELKFYVGDGCVFSETVTFIDVKKYDQCVTTGSFSIAPRYVKVTCVPVLTFLESTYFVVYACGCAILFCLILCMINKRCGDFKCSEFCMIGILVLLWPLCLLVFSFAVVYYVGKACCCPEEPLQDRQKNGPPNHFHYPNDKPISSARPKKKAAPTSAGSGLNTLRTVSRQASRKLLPSRWLPAEPVAKACAKCSAGLGASDVFCRKCGHNNNEGVPAAPSAPSAPPGEAKQPEDPEAAPPAYESVFTHKSNT